ncbi:MAG: hypothetical protein EOO29_44980 [Comamonadaceae bacterium]|nr:MAG: hypothetical protein EOO29_44980 [Comamonadaceae bacterium]
MRANTHMVVAVDGKVLYESPQDYLRKRDEPATLPNAKPRAWSETLTCTQPSPNTAPALLPSASAKAFSGWSCLLGFPLRQRLIWHTPTKADLN